jgi:hypothetical protein
MKVMKNIKGLMIIGSLALIISSCGKQTTSVLSGSYYTGTCTTAGLAENTYLGTIDNGSQTSGYGYGSASGSVSLSILSNTGQVAGQYSASAILTLNGTQYCCTTQGSANVLQSPTASDEKAIVNGLTLICNSQTGTSSGYFSGSYQAITLKVGVPAGMGGYAQGNAYLLTNQTIQGFISISSGVQVLGGIGNEAIYFVD